MSDAETSDPRAAARHAAALSASHLHTDVLLYDCPVCRWLVDHGLGYYGGKPIRNDDSVGAART